MRCWQYTKEELLRLYDLLEFPKGILFEYFWTFSSKYTYLASPLHEMGHFAVMPNYLLEEWSSAVVECVEDAQAIISVFDPPNSSKYMCVAVDTCSSIKKRLLKHIDDVESYTLTPEYNPPIPANYPGEYAVRAWEQVVSRMFDWSYTPVQDVVDPITGASGYEELRRWGMIPALRPFGKPIDKSML